MAPSTCWKERKREKDTSPDGKTDSPQACGAALVVLPGKVTQFSVRVDTARKSRHTHGGRGHLGYFPIYLERYGTTVYVHDLVPSLYVMSPGDKSVPRLSQWDDSSELMYDCDLMRGRVDGQSLCVVCKYVTLQVTINGYFCRFAVKFRNAFHMRMRDRQRYTDIGKLFCTAQHIFIFYPLQGQQHSSSANKQMEHAKEEGWLLLLR